MCQEIHGSRAVRLRGMSVEAKVKAALSMSEKFPYLKRKEKKTCKIQNLH